MNNPQHGLPRSLPQYSASEHQPANLNALAEDYLRLAYHGQRAKYPSFTCQLVADYEASVKTFIVDLYPHDYVFRKGCRSMVQVQSAWFPLIDHNPQRYLPNIFVSTEAGYAKVRHTIYQSATYPFRLRQLMPRQIKSCYKLPGTAKQQFILLHSQPEMTE